MRPLNQPSNLANLGRYSSESNANLHDSLDNNTLHAEPRAAGRAAFGNNDFRRGPVNVAVSSGRFPCGADFRCGLRLYRRDVGGVKFGSAASRLSH